MELVTGADELPMLDVYVPMMKAAAILAADELGIFRALADGPLGAAELGLRLPASPEGLTVLSDLLIAVGYLTRTPEGALANTPHAQRWLSGRGPADYGAGLAWTRAAWELMPGLPAAVRAGRPAETLWRLMERRPELGPLFSRYMEAFARHLSPELVARVAPPPGATRLLDLGGSHGLHTAAFCKAHPALHATIVDWPSALADTPARLREAGLADRVELRGGDLRSTEWGDGYDLVLLLSVAHNQSAEDNRAIFARIGQALRPGGRLVVHEYLAEAPLPAYDAAFRVTLLVETGTRTWSAAELTEWLTAAGLQLCERIPLSPPEKGTLLVAERPLPPGG